MIKRMFGVLFVLLGAYLVYFFATHREYDYYRARAKPTCLYVGIPAILLGAYMAKGGRFGKIQADTRKAVSGGNSIPQYREEKIKRENSDAPGPDARPGEEYLDITQTAHGNLQPVSIDALTEEQLINLEQRLAAIRERKREGTDGDECREHSSGTSGDTGQKTVQCGSRLDVRGQAEDVTTEPFDRSLSYPLHENVGYSSPPVYRDFRDKLRDAMAVSAHSTRYR